MHSLSCFGWYPISLKVCGPLLGRDVAVGVGSMPCEVAPEVRECAGTGVVRRRWALASAISIVRRRASSVPLLPLLPEGPEPDGSAPPLC